jgi:hypothetical protein
MDQKDWLTIPNLICRTCSIFLDLTGIDRPVSEFYATHPEGPCPLSGHVVRLDAKGQMVEKLFPKSDEQAETL